VLPVRLGGFGLRSAQRHAHAAYLAASLNSAPLVTALLRVNGELWADQLWEDPDFAAALRGFSADAGLPDLYPRDKLSPETAQAELSAMLDDLDHAAYYRTHSDVANRVRMNALQMPHALDVLTVRPDPRQGLWLTNLEATAWFQFLLGDVPHAGAHCARCSHILDAQGTHASTCPRGNGRRRKHNGCVAVCAELARVGGYSVTEDKPVTYRAGDRNPKRPDLAVLAFGASGAPTAFDFAVTSPQTETNRLRAAEQKGSAARAKAQEKHRKYNGVCAPRGYGFYAIIAESYGGLDSEAVEVLDTFIAKAADEMQRSRGAVARHFYGKLAVSLARNTAWQLLESRPRRPDPPVIDAQNR
jgi:hypothetical protein